MKGIGVITVLVAPIYTESVDDLDDLVADKREAWRATSDNARRRQRRYKKRLTNRLVRQDYFDDLTE